MSSGRRSTVAVFAVVGGVVAAAAIDSLTGRPAPRSTATPAPPPRSVHAAGAERAPIRGRGWIRSGGTIAGTMATSPAGRASQRVDVGIRSARSRKGHIRVTSERLGLGPGVGTPNEERITHRPCGRYSSAFELGGAP